MKLGAILGLGAAGHSKACGNAFLGYLRAREAINRARSHGRIAEGRLAPLGKALDTARTAWSRLHAECPEFLPGLHRWQRYRSAEACSNCGRKRKRGLEAQPCKGVALEVAR